MWSRTPDVSFCMIVRDGAATLRACLQSVAPLVDEMIVVDTGSTDDSPEVARALGARVVSVPWEGDFAAARNEYLTLARCAWVLSLDADEVLPPLEKRQLHAGLAASPGTAFVFTIRNYFPMTNAGWPAMPTTFVGEVSPNVGCTTTSTVRLFPRRPGIAYSYPVHESLLPSLRQLRMPLRRCAIPIDHMGYLQDGRRDARGEFYKALGLKKILQFPRHFQGYLELGRILLHDGDVAGAELLFARCLRLNPLCSEALYHLALTQLRAGRHEDARRLLLRGRRMFPNNADLMYLRGRVELEAGNHPLAVGYLTRALHRMPDEGAALLRAGVSAGLTGRPGRKASQASL